MSAAAEIMGSTAEIVASARAVKGEAFIAKAQAGISILAMRDMAHHSAECANPVCRAASAQIASVLAETAIDALLHGMSPDDAEELQRLIAQLRTRSREFSKSLNEGQHDDN